MVEFARLKLILPLPLLSVFYLMLQDICTGGRRKILMAAGPGIWSVGPGSVGATIKSIAKCPCHFLIASR